MQGSLTRWGSGAASKGKKRGVIPRLSHASLLHVCFVASSLLVLIYLRGFFFPPVRQLHLFLPSHGIFPVFPMPEAATVGFSYAFTSPSMAMPLCSPDPGKMPGSRGSDLCLLPQGEPGLLSWLTSPAGHCLGELGRTDPRGPRDMERSGVSAELPPLPAPC